jgi:hypothetical protein
MNFNVACRAALNGGFILFVWFCGCRQLLTAHLKLEVTEMKRVFTFIAVAVLATAIAGVAFADCGCGGKGGDSGKGGNGKLKPESIHDLLNRS